MKEAEKLKLPNVTLCAMTSVRVRETIKAMEYSMRGIEFADALIITDKKPVFLPKGIHYRHTSRLNHINDFNYKMVYELGDYIETDFVMLVHYDGFIVHPELWRDEFLDYDYIGAPWPLPKEGDNTTYRDIHGNLCRVGNSVGIRSKRLLDYPKRRAFPGPRKRAGTTKTASSAAGSVICWKQRACALPPLRWQNISAMNT